MQRVLIVGAGKVGYHLASMLIASDYRVTVMDREEDACRKVAETLEAISILGDATEVDALGDAGARQSDYVVAATGKDEDNLAICKLAKLHYGVARVIARVINPRNEPLYRLAQADATIDPTTMAAKMIRDAMPSAGMRLLSIFERQDHTLAEIELVPGSPASGKRVSELKLPNDCVLIARFRAGEVEITRGGTELAAGDLLYAMIGRKSLPGLKRALLGKTA